MADETYDSIASQVHGLVENVPTGLSGANLYALIDRSRLSILSYTGLDPGSPAVSDRFKPAIMSLVLAKVWTVKATNGSDRSVRLGDFSVDVGKGANSASAAAEYYNDEARKELAALGHVARYGRTY